VARPDGSGQPVHRGVGPFHYFIYFLKLHNAHDWTKDLLLGNLHVVLDSRKHRRLDEVTAIANTLAAGQEMCTFTRPSLDIAHHFIELGLVDLGALFSPRIKRVAHSPPLSPRHTLLNELVIAFLLHEQPRASAAALALVKEKSK